jgi:hypothetical protein
MTNKNACDALRKLNIFELGYKKFDSKIHLHV